MLNHELIYLLSLLKVPLLTRKTKFPS